MTTKEVKFVAAASIIDAYPSRSSWDFWVHRHQRRVHPRAHRIHNIPLSNLNSEQNDKAQVCMRDQISPVEDLGFFKPVSFHTYKKILFNFLKDIEERKREFNFEVSSFFEKVFMSDRIRKNRGRRRARERDKKRREGKPSKCRER